MLYFFHLLWMLPQALEKQSLHLLRASGWVWKDPSTMALRDHPFSLGCGLLGRHLAEKQPRQQL